MKNQANQIPLFSYLNNTLKNITDKLIETNDNIPNNNYNRQIGFLDKHSYTISVAPLSLIENLTEDEFNQYKREINCKHTSRLLLKETSKSLLDIQINNPYDKNDYRYKIFKNHSIDTKKWFIEIIKDNYQFDSVLYASQYYIGHPKWEDRENKACKIKVNPTSLSLTAIPLFSPFIRLNSKNKFNNFVVDIDFPEIKGNTEALLEKSNLLMQYFEMYKDKLPIIIPNFITFTSKGFQLGYIFNDAIFHKFKKEKLAMIHYKKETGNFISPNNCDPIKRETAFKLEKFYNETVGYITQVLTILFNGDKNAIQTFTQGRVIRNPLVNASKFLTLEKKDLKEFKKSLSKFAELHMQIIKEVNPFGNIETPKLEDIKVKRHRIASTTLTKQELKIHPFTITVNKKEFIENNYEFKTKEEKDLITDLFITYKLPAIDFSKTTGEGFRNVFLFTYGRFFAYELKKINPEITNEELYNKLSVVLAFINRNFERPVSLDEIDELIGNISKYVQTRFNPNVNVKFNRKLAQWKHYITKIRFGIDLLNKVFITTKQLQAMTTKDIAKLTTVSYKTLLRWLKEDKDILIKIFKEVFKMVNIKSEEEVGKINIKEFFSEFRLRTIVNDKKKINMFYSLMRNYTTLFVRFKAMIKDNFYTFMQMTALNL